MRDDSITINIISYEILCEKCEYKTRDSMGIIYIYMCVVCVLQAGQKEEDTNVAIRHKWP